jgi:replication initiation and membrane attachment protein DnaB
MTEIAKKKLAKVIPKPKFTQDQIGEQIYNTLVEDDANFWSHLSPQPSEIVQVTAMPKQQSKEKSLPSDSDEKSDDIL